MKDKTKQNAAVARAKESRRIRRENAVVRKTKLLDVRLYRGGAFNRADGRSRDLGQVLHDRAVVILYVRSYRRAYIVVLAWAQEPLRAVRNRARAQLLHRYTVYRNLREHGAARCSISP